MDLKHRWVQTLTLKERSNFLFQNEHLDQAGNTAPIPAKSSIAEQWSSQPPFDSEFSFSERLAADGLTQETFERLLNETMEELDARFSEIPAWVSAFAEAWSCKDVAEGSINWPGQVTDHDLSGFIRVIEPLIVYYRDQLEAGIQALTEEFETLPFDPGTVGDIMLLPVPGQIFWMVSRTLILEMNISRLREQLSADTSEARYQQFFEMIREPENLSNLFEEYVVLAHQLTVLLSDWVASSLEFLRRLCIDWDVIQTEFAPEGKPGVLVGLESGLGDRHSRGRTVQLANFSSGLRVVYKPRPQGMMVHFQELLEWLNSCDLPFGFRTLKVLSRVSYGWVEFVGTQSCHTIEELTRFYERQGGYLALLYALAGTDLHAENLIAVGEHPVLVDVETLFQHMPADRTVPGWIRPAFEVLRSSVMRPLLLPARLFADEVQEGIDISGLGSPVGQMSPTSIPVWQAAGTDEMHLDRKQVPLAETFNRPTLNDQEVDVANYLESIIFGFKMVYQLLQKHRSELVSETGFLARFSEDEVRVILRSTRIYGSMLNESFHPNLLRDALPRDRLFDYLWRQVPNQPTLSRIIEFEKNDLQRSNIPLFTSRPNSCDLWSSSGDRVFDFFTETSMSYVQRRFQRMSQKDMEAQVWFIRASFLSLSTTPIAQTESRSIKIDSRLPTSSLEIPNRKVERQQLVDIAYAAGMRLEELALHQDGYVNWIGLTPDIKQSIAIVPSGTDLYGGLPGIALFLAYLGEVTDEKRFTRLAEKVIFTVQSQVEDELPSVRPIGAFVGWGGILYLFTHLAVLWNRQDLFAAGERVVTRVSELVEHDYRLDVIGGAAGCIACLLSQYKCFPSDLVRNVATQCGDYLIARAMAVDGDIAWLTGIENARPVTGLAHGTAGFAWALSLLSEMTGESRFDLFVSSAIAYERRAFSAETQNWRSLRGNVQNDDDMVAWCYGAPGIGLARLNSRQLDSQFQAEIETALYTTLARGFGRNHSLCHGDLGNLELLLQASQKLKSNHWQACANAITHATLDSIRRDGWKSGTSTVMGPGLMTGIAGIGYQLLRLAEPTRVPSVLTLAPPPISNS